MFEKFATQLITAHQFVCPLLLVGTILLCPQPEFWRKGSTPCDTTRDCTQADSRMLLQACRDTSVSRSAVKAPRVSPDFPVYVCRGTGQCTWNETWPTLDQAGLSQREWWNELSETLQCQRALRLPTILVGNVSHQPTPLCQLTAYFDDANDKAWWHPFEV